MLLTILLGCMLKDHLVVIQYGFYINTIKKRERKILMKKVLVLVLCFAMMLNVGIAKCENSDYNAWLAFCYRLENTVPSPDSNTPQFSNSVSYQKYVLLWDTNMVNQNFPKSVIRNVEDLCQRLNGRPVNNLGLEPNSGSNLRSTPDYSSHANNIILKIHGNETVYLYFTFYNQYGVQWYYAVTSGGVEGYLCASRILMVW